MIVALVNGKIWQSQPTYRWEQMVAGGYLTTITVITTDWSDAVQAAAQIASVLAVMGTFSHMTVGARLEEAQGQSDTKTVKCYKKLTYYLIAKESLWLVAFVLLRAWAALAGLPLFLLYPWWRGIYRSARRVAS